MVTIVNYIVGSVCVLFPPAKLVRKNINVDFQILIKNAFKARSS